MRTLPHSVLKITFVEGEYFIVTHRARFHRACLHFRFVSIMIQLQADSEPLIVCRSALAVVGQPPECWYKDEGGKNNCIEISVQVRMSQADIGVNVVKYGMWKGHAISGRDAGVWGLFRSTAKLEG